MDPATVHPSSRAPADFEYDAVIIGSGIGGLTTATQMAAKGAKVVVLEKCAPVLCTWLECFFHAVHHWSHAWETCGM